jgi:hypothetical protein
MSESAKIAVIEPKDYKEPKVTTFGLPMSIPLRNHWKSNFRLARTTAFNRLKGALAIPIDELLAAYIEG